MKVIILGPIVNNKLSGGVGVFDEGLFKGFQNIGDAVQIISLAKSSSINNIVVGKGNNKLFFIHFSFAKLEKRLKSFPQI